MELVSIYTSNLLCLYCYVSIIGIIYTSKSNFILSLSLCIYVDVSGRILISASLLPALLDYVIQLQCYHRVVCTAREQDLGDKTTHGGTINPLLDPLDPIIDPLDPGMDPLDPLTNQHHIESQSHLSSLSSLIPSGSNSTYNYLSSVLEEEREPSFCSTNPDTQADGTDGIDGIGGIDGYNSNHSGNTILSASSTTNTTTTTNTSVNTNTNTNINANTRSAKWSKKEYNFKFVDYLIPHVPQFAICCLIFCMVYTAIFHDTSQRIGIVIFILMTLCLMLIFRYYSNEMSINHNDNSNDDKTTGITTGMTTGITGINNNIQDGVYTDIPIHKGRGVTNSNNSSLYSYTVL